MPPVDVHERAFASKRFVFLLQIIPLFSFLILSCIFTPRLFNPFFSFSSILSFLLCGCCRVCVRPSMGAVLAAQQSLRTRTRRLDTHCIQLTLRSESASPHAQETHTHDPLLTDLTLTSTQTAWAPLHSVSVWQICTVLNTANYLFQVFFQLLCATFLADPPPLRKRKEKMISFQLDQAQGNFPAVFTYSVRPDSPVHMCGAEELSSGSVFVMDIHELSCFFSSPPCFYYAVLPKIGTLQERGEAFSWTRLFVWM